MSFDHPLLSLAIVLAAGLLGGELFARIRLPKVTGWIATGIVLRLGSLPGLHPDELARYGPLVDFVLGYIAFTVGSALHFASLRNAHRRLGLLVLTEATITPAIVALAMWAIGGQPLGVSLVLAAVAVAGAPGTTMIVVREARARGVFVKTLVAAVALIDMVAVSVFAVVASLIRSGAENLHLGTLTGALGAAFGELAIALGVGLGTAGLAILLARRVLGPNALGPSFITVIFASWGIAHAFDVSTILACTFAGMAMSNLSHETSRAGDAYLAPFGAVLFTAFYTLAGMRLDFGLVLAAAGLVALFFGARLVAKSVSAFVAMSIAGMVQNVRHYLGIALLPHGGVAVGLVLLVQDNPAFAGMGEVVATVGLAALAINQLVGPSATRFALKRTGEAGLDRPRLLDFVTEQNIVVGLREKSKRAVVERLADQLYATTQLDIPKEQLVEQVMQREEQESTCLGEGFMIPHAMVQDGEAIQGVLGLSADGIDLDAPDGRPVHAVVLLVTPESEHSRHLEILSAFAQAITRNPTLREQLYQARSPAHAYTILHADDATGFNYFLDETLAPSTGRP